MVTVVLAMLTYVRAFSDGAAQSGKGDGGSSPAIAVYKRKQPRPKLTGFDRPFWIVVRRI
jgi:hypothetical protein